MYLNRPRYRCRGRKTISLSAVLSCPEGFQPLYDELGNPILDENGSWICEVKPPWYLEDAVDGVASSLWLDWLNDRYFDGEEKTFSGAQDFTRSTPATGTSVLGLIVGYLTDEERLEYSTSLRGLLMEESRENLCTYNKLLTTSGGWSIGSSMTENGVAILAGSVAYKFTSTAISNSYVRKSIGNLTDTATYTVSFLSNLSEMPSGSTSDGWNEHIVSSGDYTSTEGLVIKEVSSGVYLWSETFVVNGTAITLFTTPVDRDNGSTFIVTLPQLEKGSRPTSRIPTEGASVIRAADNNTITGDKFTSWYKQSGMTFVLDINLNAESFKGVLDLNDGSGDNTFYLQTRTSPEGFKLEGKAGGVLQTSITYPVSMDQTRVKVVMSLETDNIRMCVNGGNVLKDTSATLPSNFIQMLIGDRLASAQSNGSWYSLKAYPVTDLTDTQLQELAAL